MKNIICSIAVLAGLTLSSCDKNDNNVSPATSTPANIHVEYRIQNESGNVNVTYAYPNSNNKLELRSVQVNRTYFSVPFDFPAGNLFSVRASNINPSHSAVQVEIYVDGVLKASGNTTSTSEPAIAQGNF